MEVGLVTVLRAVWIATILPILIAFIPSSIFGCFHELLLGIAKRGKILQSSSQKFTVPQKFFCHFYIMGSVWTTLLLVAMWVYACTHISHSTKEHRNGVILSLFLLLLMETQALRRLFESIYVFKYSSSARMHILGYFAGLFFYAAAPLSLCCNYAADVFRAAQEFIVTGKDGMRVSEFDWLGLLSLLRHLRWYAWAGTTIFFWGWIHQRCCHVILGMLRKNKEQSDVYLIPHGDWFEYVSSPHYLAEIVLYWGLVVASGCLDLTVWLLFGFVVANLFFAAGETHRWYLHKFDNYPKHRFALLPYVY